MQSRFARPLPIWTMHPAFEPEVIETLEATFGNLSEKENLADAVRSACHNAVADNITDYLQDLRDCREDSLLEELDDLNLEVFYRDALEVSVAYMLMTRLGLRQTIISPLTNLPMFTNSTHRPLSTPWASLPATSRRWGCGRSAAQSCRLSGISFLQTVKKADMITAQNTK